MCLRLRPMVCRALHTSRTAQKLSSFSTPSTAAASDEDSAALGRFFYRNRSVVQWGNVPARRTTLQQLILFGRSARRNKALLMESANYLRTELTARIAHRLRDMQTLPFVAMSNEQLDSIYQYYWKTFETLRRMDTIDTMEQNERLIEVVTELLSERKNKLALIAGISSNCINYMEPEAVDLFLSRMLRSQVSREVLAKQHIALSLMQHGNQTPGAHASIGMIDTQLCIHESIQKSFQLARKAIAELYKWDPNDLRIPDMVVDGDKSTTIAYIVAHLEFILLELFKISIQATMAKHGSDRADAPETRPPAVQVTIVQGSDKGDMLVRISDAGGGLSPTNAEERDEETASVTRARGPLLLPGIEMASENAESGASLVWSFITIAEQLDKMNIKLELSDDRIQKDVTKRDPTASYPGGDGLMRLSVLNMDSKNGLPIVKLYAQLFGGDLNFRTLGGHGTDYYLRVPKFGTSKGTYAA